MVERSQDDAGSLSAAGDARGLEALVSRAAGAGKGLPPVERSRQGPKSPPRRISDVRPRPPRASSRAVSCGTFRSAVVPYPIRCGRGCPGTPCSSIGTVGSSVLVRWYVPGATTTSSPAAAPSTAYLIWHGSAAPHVPDLTVLSALAQRWPALRAHRQQQEPRHAQAR